MRLNQAVFSVVLALVLALALTGEALADKSYQVESVSIAADLNPDGSMMVAEDRTYHFKGSFSYAFRTIPLGSGLRHTDFVVTGNGQAYNLSDSEDPGTFKIISKNNEIEVRWYYRARNESRTFSLHYMVHNAVVRHQDAAVLYYKFVGDDFGKSTGDLRIVVNPPEPVEQWQVRQWAHGPLWGNSATSDAGVVTATCRNLPRNRFFELRILYPAEMFGETDQLLGYVVDEVIAEEEAWVAAANVRREKAREDAATAVKRKKIGSWAMPLLLLPAVIWFVKIARQFGRRPTTPTLPGKSPQVPSNLPPALVQYLISDRSVTGNAIMGTMLDLARRGFLEFGEEQELGKDMFGREKWTPSRFWLLKRPYFQEHQSDLAPYEAQLLKFVFEELAADPAGDNNGVRVDTEAFKKHKSEMMRFFGQWSKDVKKAGEKHGFYDQESFRGRNQGLLLGGSVVVAALCCVPFFREWAVIPGIGGVILMLVSLGIVHRTADGQNQAKRWQSLRKYLTSQEFKKSTPESVLDSIEPYLVYGAILGLGKRHLTSLGDLIPADKHRSYVPWYVCHQSGLGFSGESFGASFSASMSAVNSAMSSSTGAGGGASGGGGGRWWWRRWRRRLAESRYLRNLATPPQTPETSSAPPSTWAAHPLPSAPVATSRTFPRPR